MKYIDEYRDGRRGQAIWRKQLARLHDAGRGRMEVCGGQTHAIVKVGIEALLPQGAPELVHGPGCPVCVTPLELIDKAIQIATSPT